MLLAFGLAWTPLHATRPPPGNVALAARCVPFDRPNALAIGLRPWCTGVCWCVSFGVPFWYASWRTVPRASLNGPAPGVKNNPLRGCAEPE